MCQPAERVPNRAPQPRREGGNRSEWNPGVTIPYAIAPSVPTLDRFRRRFRHHEWATSALIRALAGTPAPSALRAVAHTLAADRIWWCRLTAAPVDTEVWPEPGDLPALAASASANWRAMLDETDERGLDRLVSYQNSRGHAFGTSVADILDHVLLHAAHHRGQANAALRAAGAVPPALDFIAWVRAHPPCV